MNCSDKYGTPINIGSRVVMSDSIKRALTKNDSEEHVKEFGDCIGIVEGYLDYNNVPKDDPTYDHAKVGPEVNVRWEPSNLRYGYHPNELVVQLTWV